MAHHDMVNNKSTKMDTDPLLLTPGPLTTSAGVKRAMLHDYGSRDDVFVDLSRRVCQRLLHLCEAQHTHVCIPLQGSGTFAVEAMLASQLPPQGRLLNLVNGVYGQRITAICRYLGRRVEVIETRQDQPVNVAALDDRLAAEPDITHVAVVYCETTTGLLNPLSDIAAVVARHGRGLLIDAMSAFGALPLSAAELPFEALAASSNKCLQGVPGMGFVIVSESALTRAQGHAHSLSLDLYEQWQYLQSAGQWRFTPPVHCLLALEQALLELEQEGGIAGRYRRYHKNCQALVDGMRALGFETFLPDALQAPIIVTFLSPGTSWFDFQTFYQRLRQLGYVLYPGGLTDVDSFRMGCIGQLSPQHIAAALAAVEQALGELRQVGG